MLKRIYYTKVALEHEHMGTFGCVDITKLVQLALSQQHMVPWNVRHIAKPCQMGCQSYAARPVTYQIDCCQQHHTAHITSKAKPMQHHIGEAQLSVTYMGFGSCQTTEAYLGGHASTPQYVA